MMILGSSNVNFFIFVQMMMQKFTHKFILFFEWMFICFVADEVAKFYAFMQFIIEIELYLF